MLVLKYQFNHLVANHNLTSFFAMVYKTTCGAKIMRFLLLLFV